MTDEERRIRRDERNLCAQELRDRARSMAGLGDVEGAVQAERCARSLELNAEERLGEMGEPRTACAVIRVDPNAPRLRNSNRPKKG